MMRVLDHIIHRELSSKVQMKIFSLFIILLLIAPSAAYGDDITNTKHNLSVSGPGAIKSTVEKEVCIFCHTPHKANLDNPPLWNRNISQANYTPYQSSSIFATVGQPTGAAKLCLSCHDGTIALGALLSRTGEAPFAGGIRFIPPGPTLIGTDLSDDHPVSFVFDSQLALNNGQLHDPNTLTNEVRLDNNDMVQCTSCHNPHGTENPKFLVKTRSFSQLCTTCHDKSGWGITSHSTVSATWNGSGVDPWPHTPFTTVDENACENCHSPHNAGSDERILNYLFEEDNCFACHNGNVASTNIETQFLKTFRHPVQSFVNIHGPTEDVTTMQSHVECMDCHNPHWANSSNPAGAPAVSGRNQGVTGLDASGVPIDEAGNLYEICYKCHADNNVKSAAPVNRVYPEINVRLEFDSGNPSYHPVEAVGANPDVPSLRSPLTENSIIYCTDCHNNDEISGPRGPHGSTNQFILERRYDHGGFANFNEPQYAMCFKCHDWENSLRRDDSFEHKRHMENADAKCYMCHDPHGISSTQGNAVNNAHLINFNRNFAQPLNFADPTYEMLGAPTEHRGRCNLVCHGEPHDDGPGGFRYYDCPC